MLEILSILLFVLAILLIAYIFYLRRERNVIVREIDACYDNTESRRARVTNIDMVKKLT